MLGTAMSPPDSRFRRRLVLAVGIPVTLGSVVPLPVAWAAGLQADFVVQSDLLPVRNHAGFPPKNSIAEMTGSGVCVLDYDEDGLPDLYFPDGGDADAALAGRDPTVDTPANRLFRNRADSGLWT